MQIATDGLEFDSDDRSKWKNFLSTRAGLRLIPKCAEHAPQLLGKGESNEILIRSGELRGFQIAIQSLLSLAEPPAPDAPPERTAWPDLMDDSAWNDGNSLTAKSVIPHA